VLHGTKSSRIAALLARMNPRLTFSNDTSFVIHEQRAPGIPVAHLFREGRALPTLLMWIVFFVSLLDLFWMTNWLPTVFHDSGITLTLSVIATALFSGGGVIGAWALGRIIDRFGPYRVLSVNYLLGAVFIALLGPTHAIGAIMICTFFAGVGIIGGKLEQTCWRPRSIPRSSVPRASAGPWDWPNRVYCRPRLWRNYVVAALAAHDRIPSFGDSGRFRQRRRLRDGPDTNRSRRRASKRNICACERATRLIAIHSGSMQTQE